MNQIDFTSWINDCARDPITLYQIQGVHRDVAPLQELVERTLRAQLQAPFVGQNQQPSRFRVMLYQVMSSNRYCNQDYFRLVGNTLARVHAAFIAQGSNPQQSIPVFVPRTLEAEILRLYEANPQGWGALSAGESAELQRIYSERQADESMIAYAHQKAAGMQTQQVHNQQFAQQVMAQPSMGSMYTQPSSPATAVNPMLSTPGNGFHAAVAASKAAEPAPTPAPTQQHFPVNVSPLTQAKVETGMVSMSSSGISIQQGGSEVNFNDFFPAAPQHEETEMVAPTNQHPVIDLEGHLFPIVYDFYTHQFDPQTGKVMEYAKHQMIPELRPEDPTDGVIVPVYTHPGDATESEGIKRHFLTDSKYELLKEPVIGLDAAAAFNLVDFYEDVWNTKTLTEFTILRTETEFVGNPERFAQTYACLYKGSEEGSLTSFLKAMQTLKDDYPRLWTLLDRRATVAVNEILNQRMGLPATIDSFTEDWFDILDQLRKHYGNGIDLRMQMHLPLIRAAIGCVAAGALNTVLLEHNQYYRNMRAAAGIVWDAESINFVIPDDESIEAINEAREATEETRKNSECLVQLVDFEYCALLPVEYASLGFELEPGVAMVVQPSLQPMWASFLLDLFARAGGVQSTCRRVLLSTIDGSIIQVHPTHGRDTENRQLMALTLQAS